MAVTFTPNLGLAKPTNSELANNWVKGTKLQEDNNLIIADRTDIGLAYYTPSVIGHLSNPSVGVGATDGQYQDIDGFIMGNFRITFVDPGVAAGSGEYGFSLPFLADGTFHTAQTALNATVGVASCIGEGYYFDASAVATSGIAAVDLVTIGGTSYARLITEAFTGKTNRVFALANPLTFANGDRVSANFFYKRA